MSRFGNDYTIYRKAPNIERERYKYIDGELTEVSPPKTDFQKHMEMLSKWKASWERQNHIIRKKYDIISNIIFQARTKGLVFRFCGEVYERNPFQALFVDEFSNTFTYLEAASQSFYAHRPPWWKSLSINLFQAFYGILVYSLARGPKGSTVVKEKTKNGKTSLRVASFPELLKLAQCEGNIPLNGPTFDYALDISLDEEKAIEHIREYFRNQFNHFPSVNFGFNPTGLIVLFMEMLRPITTMFVDLIPPEDGHSRLLALSCLQHIADQLLLKHFEAGSPGREFA